VGARSLENDPLTVDLIDEQPVCLDMAFPATSVVAYKMMIPLQWIEFFILNKSADNDLELLKILPALFGFLDVSLELPSVNWGAHQIPSFLNMSSASSHRTKFLPASVSSNVLLVVALGIATSKGSPLWSVTCRKKRLMAWDVDSPRRSNSFSTSLLSLGSIRALTVADLLILYLLTNCHKCSTNGIHNATLAIDKERTPFDDLADYVIHDEAGRALPQIAQRLKMG